MAKKRKNKRMRKRRWFTATERVEVWDRWQRGESSQSIGRVLDRGGSAIHRQLALYGGIRPQSRCRSSRALTLVEREVTTEGIAAKESIRSIAVRLGRSPSTVSREVSRNGGSDSYRASEADERTWERARRPKSCRLARSPRLRQLVLSSLGSRHCSCRRSLFSFPPVSMSRASLFSLAGFEVTFVGRFWGDP